MNDLRHFLRRASMSLLPAAHSVWIHGESAAQFDAARRALSMVAEGRAELCMLFSSARPETVEYLNACFRNDQAVLAPWPWRPVIRRFFQILKPRLLVLLDGGCSCDAVFLRYCLGRGLPVVLLNVGSIGEIHALLIDAARVESNRIVFCVQHVALAEELRSAGVLSPITVTGSLDLEPDRPSQQLPRGTVRGTLGVDEAALIVAGPMPASEQELLLEAFAEVRKSEPEARLVVELAALEDRDAFSGRVQRFGWKVTRRAEPEAAAGAQDWDVLLAEMPGELPALVRGADVAVAGGTLSSKYDCGALGTALGGSVAVAGHKLAPYPLEVSFDEDPRLLLSHRSDLGATLLRALDASRGIKGLAEAHPCQEAHRGAALRTAEVLRPLLPAKHKPGPEGLVWRVSTWRDRLAEGSAWKPIAPWFTKERIDDWATLRERLGEPQSILCVGNGPSCEDPQLARTDHDCLMRVNWRWRKKGYLARPQVVFVGDFATVQHVSDCLFGVWNEFLERRMLLRRLTRRGPRRIEYLTMSRLPGVMQARAWEMRPSNGALMIVAAAALQPERITIGGMDLFAHLEGRYPGDLRARNEYARVHEREMELAMIDLALRDYRGEVVILSDILREALDQYRERADGPAQRSSVAS